MAIITFVQYAKTASGQKARRYYIDTDISYSNTFIKYNEKKIKELLSNLGIHEWLNLIEKDPIIIDSNILRKLSLKRTKSGKVYIESSIANTIQLNGGLRLIQLYKDQDLNNWDLSRPNQKIITECLIS